MEPDMTWAQVRAIASRTLPGVRYRRHLLWRYSLTWDKPALDVSRPRRRAFPT
jgi:hypothetical protein